MNFQVLFVVLIIFLGTIQGQDIDDQPVVKLASGSVRGQKVHFRGLDVYQFLGIPFAEPPLNELRFVKPLPAKPWEGNLSVTKWLPHCLQSPFPGFNSDYQFSEDCLTLNVFTPVSMESAPKERVKMRPVMVWIHGGGFSYGSAHFDHYNGTVLAALGDVVMVSINYRLGPLGFLHLPEHGIDSNLGLWDQRLALQWVKDNIIYFGGNPYQVTIFGESAGAMSVSAHIMSPQSQGLFKNAILQSGSLYNINLWFNPKSSKTLLEKTNCESAANVINCLQSVDENVFTSMDGFLFWPVTGDAFLPDSPEKLIKSIDSSINILLGTVGNEGASMLITLDPVTFDPVNPVNITLDQAKTFVGKLYGTEMIDYIADKFLGQVDPNNPNELRLAIGKSLGDITLACPTYAFGHDAVKYSHSNVYAYYQSQKPSKPMFTIFPESNWMPATHGDDVPMVFGIPLNGSDNSVDDVILSMVMVNIWSQFARTGEVPELGSQQWSKWSKISENTVYPTVRQLNSQNFNLLNTPASDCLKNWPFPLESINLDFGDQSKSDHHQEL